jgi:hypothetical protein
MDRLRVYHRIDVGEAQPTNQTLRRLCPAKQADVDDMLDDMQRHEVIEESDSPWSSPFVLVRKKNRDLCFCIEYRKLNNATRNKCFPLSRTDDTLDRLVGAKWFSTLELRSGYWQVDLHPDDKKTAFLMGPGLWQFMVMPFGLWKAPATFGRLTENLLRGLTYESSHVPGRHDRDWLHVPRAPAQPAESVPAVPRCLPKTQSGGVPILSEGSMLPQAYCYPR